MSVQPVVDGLVTNVHVDFTDEQERWTVGFLPTGATGSGVSVEVPRRDGERLMSRKSAAAAMVVLDGTVTVVPVVGMSA